MTFGGEYQPNSMLESCDKFFVLNLLGGMLRLSLHVNMQPNPGSNN